MSLTVSTPKNNSVPKQHHPNKSGNGRGGGGGGAAATTAVTTQHCQLQTDCSRDNPVEAEFRCKQCSTHLCKSCESAHGKTHPHHDRPRLNGQQLQQASGTANKCSFCRKSRAAVHCKHCKKHLCSKCDAILHSTPALDNAHQRTPVATVQPPTANPWSPTDTPLADMLSLDSDCFDSIRTDDDSVTKLMDVTTETVGRGALHNRKRAAAVTEFREIDFEGRRDGQVDDCGRSFLLVNDVESLQVSSPQEFVGRLGCPDSSLVKVVSIFGNTGEGKSHTLNYTFFSGEEVFRTSQSQTSCTLGVWAAYEPKLNVVIIDTEGLLGVSANQNQRTRLLLKVLAISDIVIYRTRAERLHNDLFQFLGDASCAYKRHFDKELKVAAERCGFGGPLSQMGPSVIIFHETQYTDVLQPDNTRACTEQLKDRFYKLNYSHEAFSALDYVGTKTVPPFATDFSSLLKSVKKHLGNSTVRSSRQPAVVFHALQVLNTKFSGSIEKTVAETFPDQYFTCSGKCLSCGVRCQNSMNHVNIPHCASTKCKYQHQFDNQIFTCKVCHEQGKETAIIPKISSATDSTWFGFAKFAWAGYVLECPHCGIIYRSRQYWYGNRDPVETVVRTEIQHVWPGSAPMLQSSQNAAQKVLDGVTYISSTLGTLSAGPTKMVGSWMADCIAPPYWKPNSEITQCGLCAKEFALTDTKHHCRACGDGFCEDCCSYYRPVPEKGWGELAVRVCKKCFDNRNPAEDDNGSNEEVPVTARKVGEMIQSTLGTVVSAMDYPLGIIKDSARPSYWVPDEDILECNCCHTTFTSKVAKHHCRSCGLGVCQSCSPHCKPVPLRGWDQPVRVCNICLQKNDF